MHDPWKPTHYITTSDRDTRHHPAGQDIDVMLVDDNLYTEAEWAALAPGDEGCDWRLARDGEVLFRGEAVDARCRAYPLGVRFDEEARS